MITDGRTVPTGTVITADLCIIGGGPAGIAIAHRLIGAGHQVVLLEGGGLEPDPALQAMFEGEITGQPVLAYGQPLDLDELRVRVLGGASRHWGGYSRPLLGIDLEDRTHQPVGGWPLWAAELATWYPQAHSLLKLGPYDFTTAGWLSRLGIGNPLPTGPDVEVAITQKRYVDLGRTYRSALQAATDVEVVTYAQVTNLTATEDGGEVAAVQVATLEGTTFSVEAPAIVLSAGGIENARLLLASNDVVPAGLGNDHDQVGRWYADHPVSFGGLVASTQPTSALQLLQINGFPYPSDAGGNVSVLGMLHLSDDARRREDLPGLRIETTVAETVNGPIYASGVNDDQVGELLAATAAAYPVRSLLGFSAYLEPVMDPDSRVLLSSQTDLLGRPQARVEWHHGTADQDHLRRGLALLGRALGVAGTGRLQHAGGWITIGEPIGGNGINTLLTRFTVAAGGAVPENVPLGTTYHHMCTIRMDTDPNQGVVDVDCKVHSVRNLWVAGSSVFPTAPGFFPTITIVALALRLADHLATEVLS